MDVVTEEVEIALIAFDMEYLVAMASSTEDTGSLLEIYTDVVEVYHRLYELEYGEPYESGKTIAKV